MLCLGYNLKHLCFVAQITPALATGAPSVSSRPSDAPHCVRCERFLAFGHCQTPQAHLMHGCPSPRVCHCPKGPWLLLLNNGIRNQNVNTKEYYYRVLKSNL